MLQSSTAGAEGVGVLSTSASAATGYVLRPQESAAWAQRLAPLVTNLQGVLSTVGPQKFCQMMDRVASPNDWSLVSEVSAGLQKGARLEVVQDSEIAAAIEASAVAVANTGAQVRLKTVAVDQSVVGAPGHNNTGSPVMVCRVDRTVDPTPGLTRVAAFALHLEPVSQLAAAEPPYLCLVFAWLGMRQAPSSAAAVVASGEGGSSAAAASAGGSGGGSSAAASAGGGGGVRRPGDWTCPGATLTTLRRAACASSARTPRLAVPVVGVASPATSPSRPNPRVVPRRATSAPATGSAPAAARTTLPPGLRASSASSASPAVSRARLRRSPPRAGPLPRTSGRVTGCAQTAGRTTSPLARLASSAPQAPVRASAQRLTAQLTTPGLELARREGETESKAMKNTHKQ